MRMGLWSVGLMGVLAACGVAGLAQEHGLATAPATMPATEPLAVTLEKKHLTFVFWQDDRAVSPGADGHVHLRAAPFEIRFAGDVDDGLVIAAQGEALAQSLQKTKRPVVLFQGAFGAYEAGDLLVEQAPVVATWEEVRVPLFGKDPQDVTEAAEAEKKLQGRMGQTPDVLDGVVQSISTFAPDAAKEWTFVVSNTFVGPGRAFVLPEARGHEQPLAQIKALTLVVGGDTVEFSTRQGAQLTSMRFVPSYRG